MKKNIYILLLISSLNVIASDLNVITSNKPKLEPAKVIEIKKSESPTHSDLTLKIKVVEGKEILSNSKEGREIEEKLMNIRKALENDIINLQKSIESDVKALQTKSQIMTPETLELEQERIMRKKKEHELKVNQAQEDLNRHLQRELGKFNKKILDEVNIWAKQNDLDLVILAETGEVIYKSNKVDATNEIMQILNKKFEASKKKEAELTKSTVSNVTKKETTTESKK
jgi:Skp family chaperone for outer membrane proteins